MKQAIVVNHLIKKFESGSSLFNPKKKTTRAVNDISFTIQEGELVGFIGPNGAGKTTTLKILSGLLYPTSGFVSVLGFDPWEKSADFLKKISLVLGQKNQLWWDLPVIKSFELNKEIYEINNREYNKNLDELVNILDVSKLLNTQVRKLSLGQRMKMELIASLLHKPKILFLDEPTIGLDLIAQQALRDFVYEYNKKEGATILLTSHNMNDLVDLARRIIVIDNGKLIFDGALEVLTSKFVGEKMIKARLSDDNNLKGLNFPEITLSVPRAAVASAASELLQNFPVLDLTIEEMAIEDVIRKVFKDGHL